MSDNDPTIHNMVENSALDPNDLAADAILSSGNSEFSRNLAGRDSTSNNEGTQNQDAVLSDEHLQIPTPADILAFSNSTHRLRLPLTPQPLPITLQTPQARSSSSNLQRDTSTSSSTGSVSFPQTSDTATDTSQSIAQMIRDIRQSSSGTSTGISNVQSQGSANSVDVNTVSNNVSTAKQTSSAHVNIEDDDNDDSGSDALTPTIRAIQARHYSQWSPAEHRIISEFASRRSSENATRALRGVPTLPEVAIPPRANKVPLTTPSQIVDPNSSSSNSHSTRDVSLDNLRSATTPRQDNGQRNRGGRDRVVTIGNTSSSTVSWDSPI
jgi:hypothetical protein